MRIYKKQNAIGRMLGFTPDGKRFSKALIEVGIKSPGGKPSPDSIKRQIAKKDPRGGWLFDVDAVTTRVMGGFATHETRAMADAIAAGLMAIDAEFSDSLSGRELADMGSRWEAAAGKVSKAIVPVVNGILRREGAQFRFDGEGEVELLYAAAS